MKKLLIILCLGLSLPGGVQAQKKRLNANLYEQDNSESSISGKVKTVREVQGDTEVFLDNKQGKGGPYLLPQNIKNRAKILSTLNKSQKAGGPSVTLKFDDQQIIRSVEESEQSTPTYPDMDF